MFVFLFNILVLCNQGDIRTAQGQGYTRQWDTCVGYECGDAGQGAAEADPGWTSAKGQAWTRVTGYSGT